MENKYLEIRDIILRNVPAEGNYACAIEGVRLVRRDNPTEFLKDNYSKKLNIEDIAQHVNMAPSSFYRNFRQVTQVSPLQYQKQLRLYEAQRLMLSGNHNAETASYLVGYESPTQFSREYKKNVRSTAKN